MSRAAHRAIVATEIGSRRNLRDHVPYSSGIPIRQLACRCELERLADRHSEGRALLGRGERDEFSDFEGGLALGAVVRPEGKGVVRDGEDLRERLLDYHRGRGFGRERVGVDGVVCGNGVWVSQGEWVGDVLHATHQPYQHSSARRSREAHSPTLGPR
jgi:hypothetical protein